MQQPSDAEWEELFEKARQILAVRQQQQKRGLNDYNLFSSLLSITDEVRLHSRFLASLLDPRGGHYQEDLFLAHFLKVAGLADFGLNTQEVIVLREQDNIDLRITDSQKHIIVENKIFAGDQERQIERYINTVRDEKVQDQDICVVYLSPEGRAPSNYSLGNFEVKEDRLVEKDGREIRYHALSYKKDILKWLDRIGREVSNLTSLKVIVDQYREVVEKLTNQYKEKVVGLEEVLEKKENYELALKLSKEIPTFQDKAIGIFFDELVKQLKKETGPDWEINLDAKKLAAKHNIPLQIKKSAWGKLLISFEFDTPRYADPASGIVKISDTVQLEPLRTAFKEEIEEATKSIKKTDENTTWLMWQSFLKGSAFLEGVLFDREETLQKTVQSVMQFVDSFERHNGLLTEMNQWLEEQTAQGQK